MSLEFQVALLYSVWTGTASLGCSCTNVTRGCLLGNFFLHFGLLPAESSITLDITYIYLFGRCFYLISLRGMNKVISLSFVQRNVQMRYSLNHSRSRRGLQQWHFFLFLLLSKIEKDHRRYYISYYKQPTLQVKVFKRSLKAESDAADLIKFGNTTEVHTGEEF